MSSQTVFLEKLDETSNGIYDVDTWNSTYNLQFHGMPYSDSDYSCETYGNEGYDTYELIVDVFTKVEATTKECVQDVPSVESYGKVDISYNDMVATFFC